MQMRFTDGTNIFTWKISSGRTPILKGLTSKAGKKFNARLVLGEDYATSFESENKKGKQRGK